MSGIRTAALAATTMTSILWATAAAAQNAATQAPDDQGTQEIVVTAQKRAERVIEVPISITVASQEQLERQQINTVTDLARVAPSLEIQQAPGQSVGGGGQIRGIGTQSFNQGAVGSVGIVVDGVSQGNANISDLFDVSRVEVLKGPQGTLFGLTTSAGVINISTTAPEFDKFSMRVRTELSDAGTLGSDYGRQLVQGVVNLPLASNAAMRLSGNLNLTQGTNRNALTGKLDPHRTYGGRARLLWEPTPELTVNLIGDYTKVDDDGVDFFVLLRAGNPAVANAAAACGIVPGPSNRDYCTDEPIFTRNETIGGSLQVDYDGGPLTVTSITAYRDQNTAQSLNIYRLDTRMPHLYENNKRTNSGLLTQELRFATPTGSQFEITGGIFFSRLRQNNPVYTFSVHVHTPGGVMQVGGGPNNENDIENDSMAVFGQGTFHVSPQLRLIAGGRYTGERLSVVSTTPTGILAYRAQTNNENFSWRVGAQYEFSRDLIAYGTVSRGYKGGQIALPPPNSPIGTQATIIRPEIPTSYELGLKGNLAGGAVGFEVGGFYTELKDFQGQQCVPAVPGPGINCRPENISGVVSKGVELNVYGKPADFLRLNLGALYNKATYPAGFTGQDGSALGGRQLVSAPEWKITASGELNAPIAGSAEAFLAADAVYKSDIRLAASTNPEAIYPARVTLGGRIGVRGDEGQWSLSVFARNLTNNHEPFIRFLNFPDGTGGVGQMLSAQSFRQVGLSADLRF